MTEKIRFKCVEVQQPIGKYYIGVMNYDDLLAIAWADVRGLENKEREIETYSGIQRELSPNRVKEISQYVNLVDATFPTSVILAVSSDNVDFDADTNIMRVTKDEHVAKILDGQHRIAGLKGCNYPGNEFQINVAIFVDMELEDQAIVFATINKTHAKVSRSLVADLFDFAVTRSPQKTAHNIARALKQKPTSPFYEKIKILGVANDKEKETITQATFVDSLIKYISRNPMADRDLYKRGKRPEKVYGNDLDKLFLRNLWIDERDVDIAQIVWNYFSAVQEKWPESWKPVTREQVLNKSTGFIALMRFFKDAYLSLPRQPEVPAKEDFAKIFARISIKDGDFTRTNYLPGTGGQSALYNQLKEQSRL